ncbi:MAG: AAA family ATPase [Nanoarchaeota archaeon]
MIIGITGRIAAGKETLTSFLRDKGFVYIETSKIIIEELVKRGIEINRWNMQNIGDEWRDKFGQGALMKMLMEKTEPGKDYIFDSLRNAGEVEFLRNNVKNFILIAVDADQKIRFDRVLKRNKSTDPKVWEDFLKVDNRDFFDESNPLGQQVGKCMELADFKIDNSDLQNSMDEAAKIWEKIKNADNKV